MGVTLDTPEWPGAQMLDQWGSLWTHLSGQSGAGPVGVTLDTPEWPGAGGNSQGSVHEPKNHEWKLTKNNK